MEQPAGVDLSPLRKALAQLELADRQWRAHAGSELASTLRAGVIQLFEFTYELGVRLLRRVLLEQSLSPAARVDLTFNDLLRLAADAGLIAADGGIERWRAWRDMRNATSHAYDEARANAVAQRAQAFAVEAARLLSALEAARA